MSCKDTGMCKTAAICFLAGCQDEAAASPVQGAASAPTPDAYSCAKAAQNPSSPTSACAEFCGKPTCFSSRYNAERVAAQHDEVRAEERMAGLAGIRAKADAEKFRALRERCPECGLSCEPGNCIYAATSSASGAKGAAVKPWEARIKHSVDVESFAAIDAAKNAEIADLRAALADRSPAVQPSGAAADLLEFAGEVYAATRCFDGTWGKSSNEMRRHALEVKACALMSAARTATPAPEQEAAQAKPKRFEAWWEEHGQFVRAGGGDYEKCFAYAAWNYAAPVEQEAAQVGAKADALRKAAQSVVASFNDTHVSLAGMQRQVNMLADALAAQVAPPGAQGMVHFVKSHIHPKGWHECEASDLEGFARGGFTTSTLYTAPVPATTPAEQPEGDSSHVLPPFAAPAGQHDAGEAAVCESCGSASAKPGAIQLCESCRTEFKAWQKARATATNTNQPENLGAANTNKGGEAK